MARRLAIGLGLLVGLALAERPVRAQRIAVATPRVTGGTPALRESLHKSLTGGVAAAGEQAVPHAELERALGETPAIAACDTELCLRRLGELVRARAVVRASIEVLGSSHYTMRLELVVVDPSAAATPRIDDACPVCTTREANETVSRAAAALVRQLPSTTRVLAPSSEPTPIATRTAAPAQPPATRVFTRRGRVYLGLGAGAVALGLGAIGGGAALLALDGRTERTFDPTTGDPLERRFEGRLPGAILAAAGGALVLGGGLLLWRASVHREPR